MDIKETCYKGTVIRTGNDKRKFITQSVELLTHLGFEEIQIPIIQFQSTFENKVGKENSNMMFNFKDAGDRDICLAPEYTAVIQKLSTTTFKHKKDVKLFYIQECFRGEKPQAGRYRQFTQLGVEIINPSKDYGDELIDIAKNLLDNHGFSGWENGRFETKNDFEKIIEVNKEATRGLDYYSKGKGFEISCSKLGAQSQLVGGGAYEGGIGFAIGVDRLMLI